MRLRLRKLAELLGVVPEYNPLIQQADESLEDLYKVNEDIKKIKSRSSGNPIEDMIRGNYIPRRENKPC